MSCDDAFFNFTSVYIKVQSPGYHDDRLKLIKLSHVTSPRTLFSVLEQTCSGHFLFMFHASSTPGSLWGVV